MNNVFFKKIEEKQIKQTDKESNVIDSDVICFVTTDNNSEHGYLYFNGKYHGGKEYINKEELDKINGEGLNSVDCFNGTVEKINEFKPIWDWDEKIIENLFKNE